jgi:glucosamine kinase
MKLIADSGSTKTHWYLTKKPQLLEFETIGLNPVVLETTEIERSLREEVLAKIGEAAKEVSEIYFYGAGCSSQQHIGQMKKLLQQAFPNAQQLVVHNDLWASIYATCADQAGICCILGTGSNACVYNGEKIVDQLPSLGYILGDEGSGNQIGKSLLQAYFYREMPTEIEQAFQAKYQLEEHQFVQQLYTSQRPNRFLASYAQFAAEHQEDEFIQELLFGCFEEFVALQLLKFKQAERYPIHFIGSIAAAFEEELSYVLETYQLNKGIVLKSPFPKLLDYHLGKN